MHLRQFLLMTTLISSSFTLFGSQTQSLSSDSQAQASKQESPERAPTPRLWADPISRSKKIKQTALACTFITLFGFIHGATNNYLSKGAHNEHFFKAPLREWLVGLGFYGLRRLIKNPGSLYIHDLRLWFLTVSATAGIGQALGEMVPLNGHWRNFAINQKFFGISTLIEIVYLLLKQKLEERRKNYEFMQKYERSHRKQQAYEW